MRDRLPATGRCLRDGIISPRQFRLAVARTELIARQLGCCKLTLEVLENNLGAQASYRKAGFAPYQLDPQAGRALFWQKPLEPQP